MADKKISQLTAATTPLAGTEVLPIVQSGSTVKVSVDNLTAGKTVKATTFDTDVAAAGVTLTGTTLAADGTDADIDISITPKGTGEVNITKVDIDGGAIDGTAIGAGSASTGAFSTLSATGATSLASSSGNVAVGTTSTNSKFEVNGTFSKNTGDENTWGVRITDQTAQAAGVGGGLVLVGNYTDGGAKAGFAAISGAKTNSTTGNLLGDIKFYSTNVSGVLTERGAFNSSGDLTIANGNLVPATAGKGIDFSANTHAAGMTSELLNWYEEGTFTPTYYGGTTAGTTTYTSQDGAYTRIGRCVYFRINLGWSNATGTGPIRIGGLPFAASNHYYYAPLVSYNLDFAADRILVARYGYGTVIEPLTQKVGGTDAGAVPDVDAVGDISITGFYFV